MSKFHKWILTERKSEQIQQHSLKQKLLLFFKRNLNQRYQKIKFRYFYYGGKNWITSSEILQSILLNEHTLVYTNKQASQTLNEVLTKLCVICHRTPCLMRSEDKGREFVLFSEISLIVSISCVTSGYLSGWINWFC